MRKRYHDLLLANVSFPKYTLAICIFAGDMWTKAKVGDVLRIKKIGGNKVPRTATVVASPCLPFNLLPETWIYCQHDPASRTREKLFHTLQSARENFTMQSYVTVLFFRMDW